MTKAGAFKERITLFMPATTVADGIGGRVATGAGSSLTTWAAVTVYEAKPVPNEVGKFIVKQKHRLVLRYCNDPNVAYAHRVEWNGKRITVYSVLVDDKQTTITLHGYAE